MPRLEPVILGIDPGHKKCGLAIVTSSGEILARCVVPREKLGEVAGAWLGHHNVVQVAVGDGTGSRTVAELLRGLAGDSRVTLVDETGSTLAARRRYWALHPPRGLWRLIPTSLRVPPEPFDDLAAVLLTEQLWREIKGRTDATSTTEPTGLDDADSGRVL